MDDRTKRNEGRGKAERAADFGTETKKLSAQCNGLLARAACGVSKEKLFGNGIIFCVDNTNLLSAAE